MRNDMYKVIVERPRRGGGWARPGREARDPDERPAREGMRDRLRGGRKWLNENLRPLERWLERQVGRPWDAVYSELCRHVDRRNTVQQHIHQHLNDFVETDVHCREGGFYVLRYWRGMIALADSPCDLYVDPRNGCLMRNDAAFAERARRRREHRLAVHARNAGWREGVRVIDEYVQLHRFDGIWYRLELAPVPPPRRSKRKPDALVPTRAFDAVMHAQVGSCEGKRCGLYGRCGVYALRKRQLGQTELAAHGLRNGEEPDPFVPGARRPRVPKRGRIGPH
ncbi:hypothetical protein J5226_07305 [Lysobacter sp. K5869]|uniref:hypothetical protein n=1 Tax=Lysobacter sp. K5869 TaxID=2820808 RepID=UPI001C061411|nr:hypothetical protein [Lysobacter sp. K5869]QWP78196.1 hypothetical protein J5226_07305 [Lysobacter sp. K5869]